MLRLFFRLFFGQLILLQLLYGWGAPLAQATQIPWCMRVVPSGELVTRYGAWCD